MSATLEAVEAVDGAPAPHWHEVPTVVPRVRSAALKVATRVVVGALVVGLLWWLGRPTQAVIVAIAVVAAATIPPVGRAFVWVGRKIESVVGHALSFLLIGMLELFLFAPVALIARVTGRDPLSRGARPTDPTFWERDPGRDRRSLHRRQFTYDRPKVDADAGPASRRLPMWRVRGALGFVVVLVLADLALGAVIDGVDRVVDPDVVASAADSGPNWNAQAFADEPAGPEVVHEVREVWEQRIPLAGPGWAMPDYNGRYVHVKNLARRSYEPRVSGTPLKIAFFGGSTMFGAYQRDKHTIPSEFARLAEADGIDVEVVNYGQQAYTSWQEAQLLLELTGRGFDADLVVFYDGVNDLFVQATRGPTDGPQTLVDPFPAPAAQQSLASRLTDEWESQSAVARAGKAAWAVVSGDEVQPGGPVLFWPGDQTPERTQERARAAVELHDRAVRVMQAVAAREGFTTEFFWQPNAYTKPIVAGEESVPGGWGEDPAVWAQLTADARQLLTDPVVDLSDILDETAKPVMVDFHHTNELGAKVIARQIYARTRAALLALPRGGS